MAGSRPLLAEFGIQHRLQSCALFFPSKIRIFPPTFMFHIVTLIGHCQNSGEDRLDRNSAPDECQRVKGVIGEIEYTLTEKNPNLRVDLVIVGTDDKTVHQATYWPSTGYGIVSNYKVCTLTKSIKD